MTNHVDSSSNDSAVEDLIKKVEFQLENVKGLLLSGAPESAAVKSTYLRMAAEELELLMLNKYP